MGDNQLFSEDHFDICYRFEVFEVSKYIYVL